MLLDRLKIVNNDSMNPPEPLITFSQALGDPNADLAILAEGNTSCKDVEDEGYFWVKASGKSLRFADSNSFCKAKREPLLKLIESSSLPCDDEIKRILVDSSQARKSDLIPSVESFMHAWLLEQDGVNWIAHTHPEVLLSLLCTEDPFQWADKPLFPDEIVCCGPVACTVKYVDPGLILAREIAKSVNIYKDKHGMMPKVIWLQNHGLITLGATLNEALSATYMSAKVARVRLGALQTGRKIVPLPEEAISRIDNRPDEHHRKRLLESPDF